MTHRAPLIIPVENQVRELDRGDLVAAAVVADQVVQPVQAGGAGGQLRGVDVAVDPEGRLVRVGAGGLVG